MVAATLLGLRVTYDSAKDAANRRKHGVALSRAGDLDFAGALFEADVREDYGEERYNALGFIGVILYSLTFAVAEEAVRAISLRKATKEEEKRYAESV